MDNHHRKTGNEIKEFVRNCISNILEYILFKIPFPTEMGVVIVRQLDLQLLVQSVPTTT